MTYEAWKIEHTRLENEMAEAATALGEVTQRVADSLDVSLTVGGLTPDAVRETLAWRGAKGRYTAAFNAYREFNGAHSSREFQIRARDERRAGRLNAKNSPDAV